MEFLTVNALGTVPVLVTADGHKEIGIVDIRKYLMDKHGDKQIFRGKCRHYFLSLFNFGTETRKVCLKQKKH